MKEKKSKIVVEKIKAFKENEYLEKKTNSFNKNLLNTFNE